MLVGAAEDFVKQPDPIIAKANVDLAAMAGFDSLRVTAAWSPGETAPSATELTLLQNVAAAASVTGMQLFLAVYPVGSRATPLTDAARAEFAAYATSIARAIPAFKNIIVGNEPNLNRFWMPQFNLDGSDAAAPAYAALLAQTYDALKAVSPAITVIGGALAARGEDRPTSVRHTQSPTRFITDLGTAYRASGRTRPLMDMFAFHPYPGNTGVPPTVPRRSARALGLADYGRLVRLLGRAFDGTRQRGSTLPILYAEFGVESQVPPHRAYVYTGREPATTRPVDESTQATYYRQAIELAYCQPTVRGIFVFHVADEHALEGWQSGVYYADSLPKTNLETVRGVAQAVRRGRLARCSAPLEIPVQARVTFPRGPSRGGRAFALRVQCDLNCVYLARLERLPRFSAAATIRGRAVAGASRRVAFRPRRFAAGLYRFKIRISAAIPRSRPVVRVSPSFRIGPRPRARRTPLRFRGQ